MKRIPVRKTHKLYIGGAFPRSESARTFRDGEAEHAIEASRASRKDLRNAVVAARKAQPGWAADSPFLRSQILYRAAEMVESRAESIAAKLATAPGTSGKTALAETHATADLLVHYAGWCDKYQSIFSSVNPVSGPFFNFSVPEPVGVVGIIAPAAPGLLGLAAALAPALAGGNTAILLAAPGHAATALAFAEALATSDLPGGVANILTGLRDELLPHFASHMDIDSLIVHNTTRDELVAIQTAAADSLKRLSFPEPGHDTPPPYDILHLQEIKTTWHPVAS